MNNYKLVAGQLKYNSEIEKAFQQLKVLINCNDDYLGILIKESQASPIDLLNLIYEKIWEIQYPKTLEGQTKILCKELKYLRKTAFDRFCELLRIGKFVDWVKRWV